MTTQNPYPTLGPQIKNALDYIITNLPLNPTFENLNDLISSAFYTPDPANPSPLDEVAPLYIKSVLPNVYNSYIVHSLQSVVYGGATSGAAGIRDTFERTNAESGKLQSNYSEKQHVVITLLLEGIKTVPVEGVATYINTVEEKIVLSGLSYQDMAPLFIATAVGKAVYEYWMQNIPQPSAWAVYMVNPNITLQAMDAVNYNNVCNWVSASMQGALQSYCMVKPPQLQLVDIFTAIIGATGMAAGKMVFKW